jgi:tetratricopeptide (TPR) repeat protein
VNPGDRYGRYRIIRMLGRGAMGEVYLARDDEARREVAVKIVYKGPEREDQEVLDAERLGAELQKRLSGVDARVTPVNRYGEINGDLFIEMAYIEGEDLSAILARGPANPGLAAMVARELCEMLENLGSFTTTIGDKQFVGVIHGDLKPRNIRLNSQNHVKVLDFGIAKALSQTRRYTMNVFASTAYCSPERLETQNMDAQSDLWSVGALLYQMLSGRLPFDEPTKERLERRIRSSEPPPPLPAICPEPLRLIVMRMLARDPARRYPTAREVRDDIVRWQRGEPIAEPPPYDADATVRTTAPLGDEDATTRSAAPAPGSDATARSPEAPLRQPVAVGESTGRSAAGISVIRRRRGQRLVSCMAIVAVVCVLLLGYMAFQYHVWSNAQQLKTDLQAERVSNLDDAWTRYQNISKHASLPGTLWGARSALKKQLIAAADSTINEYRNEDAPAVYIGQWQQARNLLSRALELDPDDNAVKGRLRLCEGHIDRITAGGLHGVARQKRLGEAVQKFEEAAALMRKSPDPYLGLARIYSYDLNDMDKAEEALRKADDYGHPEGRRERAQLADGYRRLGDRVWRESRGFTQSPDQERNYLEEARRDYVKAQDLYQQAGLYGDSARNQLQAIQGQQRVEQRLSAIQGGIATP